MVTVEVVLAYAVSRRPARRIPPNDDCQAECYRAIAVERNAVGRQLSVDGCGFRRTLGRILLQKQEDERDGQYAATRQRFDVPFPEELRRNIINRNMRLLTGNLPSYDAQIRKAASRGDKIAVNHRMAAFMESYFDVLFALNRRTHPGEKRLDKLAERDCAILPKDFRKYIDTLFDSMYADQAVFSETLGEIVDDLRQTVDANL